MKYLIYLVLVILFSLIWAFSFTNFQPVTINLYFTSITLPLAFALTFELLAGMIIGILFMMLQIIKLKARNIKLAKQLASRKEF